MHVLSALKELILQDDYRILVSVVQVVIITMATKVKAVVVALMGFKIDSLTFIA